MKKVEVTLLEFGELEKSVAAKVIERYRDNYQNFWLNDDLTELSEDLKTVLAVYGFHETSIYWSLGYCQGDGAMFLAKRFDWEQVFKHCMALDDKQRRYLRWIMPHVECRMTSYGRYCHERSWHLEFSVTSITRRLGVPSRVSKLLYTVFLSEESGYVRDLIRGLCTQLRDKLYDYQDDLLSDKAISERLLEDEHYYLADGTRWMDLYAYDLPRGE